MKSSPDEGSSTCSTPRRSRNATVGTEGSLSVTLQGKTPTGAKSQRLSLRTTSQLLGTSQPKLPTLLHSIHPTDHPWSMPSRLSSWHPASSLRKTPPRPDGIMYRQ
ncbi:hypothetical protein TNCT_358041 [Trichonephila clavata]|uniref:Uncharacterized protein n=1 Tax=Trichonephila clavata TaxID=2740835 RepID=A0A8X6HN67_TRICU|nr:hypothetical protein TNCT_358041 [Trichonephila clavata]